MEEVRRPLWQTGDLDACSVDQLRQRVLGGDLNSETLRVLADKQDKANKDLMYACREGDTDAVRRLLAEGADVGKIREVKDKYFGRSEPPKRLTPLLVACQNRRVEVARLLLDHDSEAALTPPGHRYGLTPLSEAIQCSGVNMLRLLLARGAAKYVRNDHRALDNAVDDWRCGDTEAEAVRLLLEHGADPNGKLLPPCPSPGARGQTPLSLAAGRLNYNAVRCLLDYGANPDAGSGWDNSTPLHAACFPHHGIDSASDFKKSVAVARLLLARGATIDSQTWRHLRVRAPKWYGRDETLKGTASMYHPVYLPSNAQPLRRLFHKHYSILVRLHCIGTPTTRPGPECWRLEAANVIAPQIASFLVPTPPREAVAYWTKEWHSTEDLIYGSEDDVPCVWDFKTRCQMDFVYYLKYGAKEGKEELQRSRYEPNADDETYGAFL